ncbi:TIGR00730 family Rossman fold protein [Candidatus Auribacterota bacterium]
MRSICVFCSSSDELDPVYYKAAEELGEAIAITGTELIYGGGMIGLMGVLAKSAQKHKGKVTGIIPKSLARKGIMYEHAEEMIETKDLRDRKELMEKRADAFIAIPGGFGTLEEVAEIITAKQLHYHKKPIVLINTNNFFDDLLGHFDRCYKEKFIDERSRELYFTAKNAGEAIEYINKTRDYL